MTETATAPCDAPLIPIVLGVVGHRDLRPDDDTRVKLKDALTRVFQEFDKAYPNSPKILLSPLAPGADQLAAHAALNQGRHWTVRAPLPFEPALALQSTSFRFDHLKTANNPDGIDFAGQEQFREFLKHGRVDWFVVPLPSEVPAAGRTARRRGEDWFLSPSRPGGEEEPINWAEVVAVDETKSPEYAALRRACYANPGGYIVRHCHTLLALWDEGIATKPSGTAEIVRFQLGGISLTHYPWNAHVPLGFDADRGPVIVVHAPRVADGTDTAAGLRSVLVPSGIDAAHYGEQVDVPQVARKLTSWERFWARVRQALGLEAHDDPVPEGAAVGPGPWRPNPLRKKCPEYDQFLSVCQTIDDFNREAARWYRPEPRDPKYQKRLDKVEADAGRAFATADPEDLSRRKRPLGAWYRQFLRVRETAGQLAVDLSPRHEKASKWLFGLLFFALAVFHLYAHPVWHFDHSKPMEHLPALLAVYGLVWVVMIVWVVHLWWIRLDNRRHDYRALAEALRVRQAYALAGLSHSVADTYLSQLRTELAWVRRALQHLCPPSEFWKEHFRGLSDARKLDRMRQLEKDWVEYQEGQHQGRKKGEREKAVWHRRWGFGLAMAGLVVLALLPWVGPLWAVKFGPTAAATPSTTAPDAAKEAHPAEAPELPKPAGPAEEGHGLSYWLDPSRPINLLVFAGTLATILGGLSIAVSERQAHEELAKQYDRMHVVFRRGGRELDLVLDPEKRAALRTGTAATRPPPVGPPATVPAAEPVDFERAQRIVEELGREALQENAEWLLLRRSKPLELPLGT